MSLSCSNRCVRGKGNYAVLIVQEHVHAWQRNARNLDKEFPVPVGHYRLVSLFLNNRNLWEGDTCFQGRVKSFSLSSVNNVNPIFEHRWKKVLVAFNVIFNLYKGFISLFLIFISEFYFLLHCCE